MTNDSNKWKDRGETSDYHETALRPAGGGGRSSISIGRGQRILDSTGSDPNAQPESGGSAAAQPRASLLVDGDDGFGQRDTLRDRAPGDGQGLGRAQSAFDEFRHEQSKPAGPGKSPSATSF